MFARLSKSSPFLLMTCGLFFAFAQADWAYATDPEPDGLPDDWELEYFGDIDLYDGNDDPDLDQLTNAEEYSAGTNPTLADTDGDEWTDAEERDAIVGGIRWYTDPTNPHSFPGDGNLIINPGIQWLDGGGNPIGWTAHTDFPQAVNPTTATPFHPTTNSRVLETSVEGRTGPIPKEQGFQQKNYWRQRYIPNLQNAKWYQFSVDIGTNGYRPYTYQPGDTIPENRTEGQIEFYSGADVNFKTEGLSGLQNFRIGTQGIEYTTWNDSMYDCDPLGAFTEVAESLPVPMSTMTRYLHIPKGNGGDFEGKVFSDIRGIGTTYADNFVLKEVTDSPDIPDFSRSGTLSYVPYKGDDFFPIVLYGTVNGLPYMFAQAAAAGFNAVRVDTTHETTDVWIELLTYHLAAVPFTWHTYVWSGMGKDVKPGIVDDPLFTYTGPGYMKDRIDYWTDFENLLFFRGPDEYNQCFGQMYRASNELEELYSMRSYLKSVAPDAQLHYSTTPIFLETDGSVKGQTFREWYYGLADSVSFTWNTPNAYADTDRDTPRMMLVGSQTRKARSWSGGKPALHTALGVREWTQWDGTTTNDNVPYSLQRFQIWNSIINGATGVLFYAGTTSLDITDPDDLHHWNQMKSLTAELADLSSVLLEPTYVDEWNVSHADAEIIPRIEIMMKHVDGKIYLCATSVWYEDIYDVTIELPGVPQIASVTALNEVDNGDFANKYDREVLTIEGNTFTDYFVGEDTSVQTPAAPGYATHVYEIEVDCDDGVYCTVDAWVNNTCVHTPHDALCDDGDDCNGAETCDPVNDCQPGAPRAPDPIPAEDGSAAYEKNRYISFIPNNDTCAVAYKVTMTASALFPNAVDPDRVVEKWVVCTPRADGFALLAPAPEPVFQDWSQWSTGVHVTGCAVVPASTYEIVAVTPDGSESAPLIVDTVAQPLPKQWGDVVGAFEGSEWGPPDGVVNMDDVYATLRPS